MSPFKKLFIAHPYFGFDERPSGWFICNDGYLNPEIIFTADPHLTTIKLGGRQILIQKALTVKIYVKNAKQFSHLPDSFHATSLKRFHNDFADTSVAYSDSLPRTHISIQNYSIHFISAEILFFASYNAIIHIKPKFEEFRDNAVSLHGSNSLYRNFESGAMVPSSSSNMQYFDVNNQDKTKWSNQENDNISENGIEMHCDFKDDQCKNVYASYVDTESVITQQIPTFVQNAFVENNAIKERIRYNISFEKRNCAYAPIRFRNCYETYIPITVTPCYTPQLYIPFQKLQSIIYSDKKRDRSNHHS
ncbi:uncharacterized protein LOC128883171 [Hylaeus volcanicus]|uniref:uncharacterized protein LOC128883171 n=1 Tax=Hylaeus volcanicus TaxID=313075 RepID=UPI0023B78554|nr:uncharacterized protein LOC128883171 [Hylaeus volcanicus]